VAANPGRPNTLGYTGSEEFIRLQFEEYLLALLAAVKYRVYAETNKKNSKSAMLDVGEHISFLHMVGSSLTDSEGDPAADFGIDFVNAWMQTENFRIFHKFTGIVSNPSLHSSNRVDRFSHL
jgi:Transport protein Avl9